MIPERELENVVEELRLVLEQTGMNHADQLWVLKRLQDKMTHGKAMCIACGMLVPGGSGLHRAACGRYCAPTPLQEKGQLGPFHRDIEYCPSCTANDAKFHMRPLLKL